MGIVLDWCWQAKHRGLLVGDLNTVQVLALMIAEKMDVTREAKAMKRLNEHMDDLMEIWLCLEHPAAWRDLDDKRKSREEGVTSLDKMDDAERDETVAKMRKLGL